MLQFKNAKVEHVVDIQVHGLLVWLYLEIKSTCGDFSRMTTQPQPESRWAATLLFSIPARVHHGVERKLSLFGGAATSCRHPCLHFRPRHSRAVPLSLSEFIKKMKETSSNTRRGHQGYKKGSAAATSCRRGWNLYKKRSKLVFFISLWCAPQNKAVLAAAVTNCAGSENAISLRAGKSSAVRTQRRSLARVLMRNRSTPFVGRVQSVLFLRQPSFWSSRRQL